MRNMLEKNALGLLAMRQFEYDVPEYCYFFATQSLTECRVFISNRGIANVFPINISTRSDVTTSLSESREITNFQAGFLNILGSCLGLNIDTSDGLPFGVTSRTIFNYLYAVFHSPSYRSRYAEFLKIDFPRLPLPGNLALFHDLCRLGADLVALHLMESSALAAFMTAYAGPPNPNVTRVGWSNNTVWLDAPAPKKGQPSNPGTIGFHNVPESVWNFHIGGYQVCAKWLKDRKGRTLSDEDIVHYQKIVVAISETIRLMAEIDEVIEAHGGWPGAFAVGDRAVAAGAETPAVRTAAAKPPAARPEPLPLFPDVDVEPTVKAAEPPEESVPYGTSTVGAGATVAAADHAAVGADGAQRSIDDYDRVELKAHFLAALPDGQWVEREEAIRAFARRLGFQRTGALIAKAGRSVINGLLREDRLEAEGSRIRRTQ